MDQLICAPLSHTHYWYEVGMLKVPTYVSHQDQASHTSRVKIPVNSIDITSVATSTYEGKRKNRRGWAVGYVQLLLGADNKWTVARSVIYKLIYDTW